MKISREAVLLIKSFEGFRPRAQRRSEGQWVVGYGHTASAREGSSVSEADAELLLQYDLIPVQAALTRHLSRALNQHQYDALASFAFSVGPDAFAGSDVLKRINAGEDADAIEALIAWPEPPVRDAGLQRRAAERALFNADPAAPVALADLLAAPIPARPEASPADAVMPEAITPSDIDTAPSSAPVSTSVPATPPAIASAATPERDETPPAPIAEAVLEALKVDAEPTAVILPETRDNQTAEGAAPDTAGTVDVPIFAPLDVSAAPQVMAATESAGLVDALSVSSDVSVPDNFSPPAHDAARISALGEPREAPYGTAHTGPVPLVVPEVIESADPYTGAVAPSQPLERPPLSDEAAAEGSLQLTGETPAGEAISSPRLVWPRVESAVEPEAPALFDAGSDLQTEGAPAGWGEPFDAKPKGFSWRRVWAYLVMGGFGLVSLAMAMAALRKASMAVSDVVSIVAIASVLAIIGAACVGVSAYNIYQRLSDDR